MKRSRAIEAERKVRLTLIRRPGLGEGFTEVTSDLDFEVKKNTDLEQDDLRIRRRSSPWASGWLVFFTALVKELLLYHGVFVKQVPEQSGEQNVDRCLSQRFYEFWISCSVS